VAESLIRGVDSRTAAERRRVVCSRAVAHRIRHGRRGRAPVRGVQRPGRAERAGGRAPAGRVRAGEVRYADIRRSRCEEQQRYVPQFTDDRFVCRAMERGGAENGRADGAAGTCRAPFLVSWGVDDVGSVDAKAVENVEGVLDVRRYEVIEGTTLERFVRRHGGAMKGLVLVEANEGATLPDTLSAIVGRDEKEIGWFRLKRVYR